MIIDFLLPFSLRRPMRFSFVVFLAMAGFFATWPAKAAVPDEDCLGCHEDKDLKDNTNRSLWVDKALFADSIHGRSRISCVSCHSDLGKVRDFPHAEKLAKVDCSTCHPAALEKFSKSIHGKARTDQGEARVHCQSCHGHHDVLESSNVSSKTHPLQQPATCGSCHFDGSFQTNRRVVAKDFLQSVHGIALVKFGLSNNATCVTCHGSHEVVDTSDPISPVSKRHVPNTYGHCHEGILRDYLEGVHGQDFKKGIRDVPVCTDCHGEHQILAPQDKKSKVYATQVAMTCTRCHDNQELARVYNLPAQRLRSFEGSFHGIASHFGETRVANCISCHGFHNIRPSSDPKSSINPANLPNTCGQCHGGGSQRLTQVKVHVLDPKAANYAGYIVQNFYFYLIAIVMGSFLLYISADLKARFSKRSES